MHTAQHDQQIVGWLGFWARVGGVFSRLMRLFGLVCGHAFLGGVWLWGYRGLAGDLYIYFANVQGLCVHFRGGLHVVWVGSCPWLYLMGMGVCVYVDVYVWLLGLAREI